MEVLPAPDGDDMTSIRPRLLIGAAAAALFGLILALLVGDPWDAF
jgi:hypothetical protein